MRLTLFALLPLAACAMDEDATEPSTPDVISHIDTNCPTGSQIDADFNVTPSSYAAYQRPSGDLESPCRTESIVEFTVTGASASHPVELRGSTEFGDAIQLSDQSDDACALSALTMQLFKKNSAGNFVSIWGPAVGHGAWNFGVCTHTGGGNSGDLTNGVYRMHATALTAALPPYNVPVKIFAGTPPSNPPPPPPK